MKTVYSREQGFLVWGIGKAVSYYTFFLPTVTNYRLRLYHLSGKFEKITVGQARHDCYLSIAWHL